MRLLLLLLPLLAAAAPVPPTLRLPSNVAPVRYDLDLTLVPGQTSYFGTVQIAVKIDQPTNILWLNATELNIEEATVRSAGRQQTATVIPGGKDFVGLETPQPLAAGAASIRIAFKGVLNTKDVEGLFQQKEGGATYVFTQFEPTSARRAFPCFDEPGFKTPWKITLRVNKDHLAFANTPSAGEAPEANGMKVVRFAESKPMPSYLVAIAVGPFEVVDGGSAGRNRVPLRFIVPQGRGAEAAYARQVTPTIFNKLEEYFGTPYPYEKLDQVTIPLTVAFGAMENAGLITYAQNILLARKQDDSISRRRHVVEVIAHEIGHQWFGNMVTPAWWDDIWLNEAFATWIEDKMVDELEPSWRRKAAVVRSKTSIMQADGMLSARVIRQRIENTGDIGQAFDGITYNKGAAVIRMFENWLGEAAFRKGVQLYMRKHAWGNATSADFLNALSTASGKNVTSAFSTFLDRGGVPLLTVTLRCTGGTAQVAMTQERFLPLGSKGAKSAYWQIPVCFSYENGKAVSRECTLLADPKDQLTLKNARGCPEWISADEDAAGYYRVLYKGDLQNKLIEGGLEHLAVHERVNLIRNAHALIGAGLMPAADGFKLVQKFASSADPEVVGATINIVQSLKGATPPDLMPRLAAFVQQVYGAKARELGWIAKAGENETITLLRPSLLSLVATTGQDAQLAAEARKLAESWLKDRTSVDALILPTVLDVAAYRGDRAFYDRLRAAVRTTTARSERTRLISAIGGFSDAAIARDALEWMLSGETDIRETIRLLTLFRQQEPTMYVPWEFVVKRYGDLEKRLPTQLGVAATSDLPEVGKAFCDAAGRERVRSFFEPLMAKVDGGARSLAQTLEGIELCAARIEVQRPQVAEYLNPRQ